MKTAAEILKCWQGKWKINSPACPKNHWDMTIKAMEEYASQFSGYNLDKKQKIKSYKYKLIDCYMDARQKK